MSRSASRSASKSRLAGAAGTKSKRESAAPDEEEAAPEVPQLAWRVLSEEVVRELARLTVEEVAGKLAEVLSFRDYAESLQEAAQLDYFVAGYWFAREHQFTEEQISAFFTLLHIMLENLKARQLPLSAAVVELQHHLKGVGTSPSTSSLRCFTPQEAVLAVEYISSTLFQHYRLFQFLFTEQQQEELLTTKLLVDLPPEPSSFSPPPLEEAVPLDLYERYMAPTPSETQKMEHLEIESETTVKDEDGDDARLLSVSAEELKSLMETMAKEKLTSYQSEVSKKLKLKQEVLLNRLAKLEKTLT